MSKHTQINRAEVEDIPEVLDFLNAHTLFEEFKAKNEKLMAELYSLADNYNTTLQAADKAVRGQGVNCGPWEQLTPTVKYDGEKLYSAVGREDFVRLGGIVRQVNEYVIDKGTIEAAIAGNRLPQQIVDLVRTVGRKYKSIPKVELP